MAYFKLAYADPRPYMISEKIHPWTCSKEFGNPSGHAMASSIFSIVLFLDIFHGKPIKGSDVPQESSWCVYIVSALLGLFWATSIPFTRFLLGAHSLDQLVYGSTMGILIGIVCHFVMRDHIIKHINDIKDQH